MKYIRSTSVQERIAIGSRFYSSRVRRKLQSLAQVSLASLQLSSIPNSCKKFTFMLEFKSQKSKMLLATATRCSNMQAQAFLVLVNSNNQ